MITPYCGASLAETGKRPLPSVTVIICTVNEEQNIGHVLPGIPGNIDEIIMVDGHSRDRTIEVAKELRPDIKVLSQPGIGKGDAIKHGVRHATGDIVITIDADGETDPADIPRFIEPLRNGADLAKGTRFSRGCPPNMRWHRWFGNRVLARTCNLLSGSHYTDICSGYNAFWRDIFHQLDLRRNDFEMEQEMMVKARKKRLKVVEVAHLTRGRLHGTSKVNDIRQGFVDWLIIIRECLRPG